jgi:hypothetical protein
MHQRILIGDPTIDMSDHKRSGSNATSATFNKSPPPPPPPPSLTRSSSSTRRSINEEPFRPQVCMHHCLGWVTLHLGITNASCPLP